MANSVVAELSAAMMAIEVAAKNGWTNLWLECDSSFVVEAFNLDSIVPWKIRSR